MPFGDIVCLFFNLTSLLIRLYPCYIKDYLRLEKLRTFLALVELRIPIAPEPAPEKKGESLNPAESRTRVKVKGTKGREVVKDLSQICR